MAPKVSVVMAVYNGARYLALAVESILNQTFSDFEFIIINDGSTDGTSGVLERYDDARIVPVNNLENMGLARSLNRGLALAQGEYVARMDADDIAMPYRFKTQVALLEEHPEIGILGSPCRLIDTQGREQGLYPAPPTDLHIRWRSLIGNPFWHPTVMLRRCVLVHNNLSYDERLETSQDYDLWVRILKHTCGANLPEPLVQYRPNLGITRTRRELQLKNHDAISLRTIREQLPEFSMTLEQAGQLRALFVGGGEFTPVSTEQRLALAHLYLDMLEAFMGRRPESADLRAVKRFEALRVARSMLRPPIQLGWGPLFRRLLTMDPGMLGPFLAHVSRAMGRRLRQPALDFLRPHDVD